ncbi:MAG: hypothetical protein DRP45_00325 [Candidatus Zixiibacteriota bacterium]|nr:MAG: hypothetical protein DRP45_00325 [candidate division Zixibacteria bacterium]
MATSSQRFVFDNRLLAIEELLRQRQHDASRRELEQLSESDFGDDGYQLGLFLSLRADDAYFEGNYAKAMDMGQKGAAILADYPLNRRYARVLLVLSKVYSALGDLNNAEKKAYDSLASYRRAGDKVGQIDCLNRLARISFLRSDYRPACQFLDEAIDLAIGNPRKTSQLTGNAGRIRVLLGEWRQAESDLRSALAFGEREGDEVSVAINLLSLAYLHLRRREHVFSERCLSRALEIIDRHGLCRERVIYLEYAGELALEKGDNFKAKSLLREAYDQGKRLAPESSLVSQSVRRLGDVELALDNVDAAMKYGQKALDLSVQIGERTEIALSHRVIAEAFALRQEFDDALEHGRKAIELARLADDPVDLARTLLVVANLMVTAGSDDINKIRNMYEESSRVFRRLKMDYWTAEADFQMGVFACRQGDLTKGFKRLSRSEKAFAARAEVAKVRRVNKFLSSLADQAVALSISEDNEYRLFGKLAKQEDVEDLKACQMDETLNVLLQRTGADRAIIVIPEFDDHAITASFDFSANQAKKFCDGFERLLGEEIFTIKPTLLLDCRRDPYINDLFPEVPDAIASVMVVPFMMSDRTAGFVYLDKISKDNTLNPFSQDSLNFSVGFSDIVAFKSAELQRLRLLEDNRRLKSQLGEQAVFPNIISKSPVMLDLLTQVHQVINSNISIVIEGPTGSGKDLLARAIHYNSQRRDKRFISVNCAALPETLLESELFGYHKGAFTGADRDKPGLFEEADGGTFFLDEIADMPLGIQAKILRVLEEKEIVRLGESVPRRVDVRVVSATNKDLKAEMAERRFRQDLYYRLSALSFRLPALSERREDIPLLAAHFLNGSDKELSVAVVKHLVTYDWPGNVRELENEIKKLALLAGDSQVIEPEILSSKFFAVGTDDTASVLGRPIIDDVIFSNQYGLYDHLAAHEKKFIVRALRERNGVKKHAAASLNIPESTLRLKIKEYRIDLNQLDSIN